MNQSKKLVIVITSVVASILASTIIFLSVFFHSQKQNNLQQEIATLKKEKDQLLAQVSQINWQTYKGDFYNEPRQKRLQRKKIQLQKKIQDLNVDCNQTDLEDQKECWLDINHEISQTISNFHRFNNSYYQNYQAFNNTFNDTKNQFQDLLTNINTLNITQYDLGFLSPEIQASFQNNKNQIIDYVQQFNKFNNFTCLLDKTLYQQLKCYQAKNQLINKTLNEFNNFDHDYQKNYQIFNVSFDATKKQFQDLLTNISTLNTTAFNHTPYDLDFLSPQDQKTFQSNKSQIIDHVQQLNTSKTVKMETCFHNKNLYQQLKCYQEENQLINKTLNEFSNFGHDYQKSYQLFNVSFNNTKNQFQDLLTNFNNKEYDLGFVSPQDQKTFRDGKNAVVADAQQKNSTCFHNKTLYQQAMCCQQQNQLINKAIENFNNNYYDEYQKFIAIFQKVKTKFDHLSNHLSELNNKKYDLGFLPLNQVALQSQQIKNISKTVKSVNFMCATSKTLYQQLECYQQQNQLINKIVKEFNNFDHDYQDNYQKFIAILQKAKTTLEDSLTIVKEINITEFSNKEYDLTFLSPQDQKTFQSNKSQIIDYVQQFNKFNNFTCSSDKTLYQQLECYQQQNQLINKIVKEFNNFDHDYQDNYQKFTVSKNKYFTELKDLLTIVEKINITEFSNKEYDLTFLSSYDREKFQNNKSQIIDHVQQFNKFNNFTCLFDKTLYQQLECYQEENQKINDTINNFHNFDHNYQDNYQKFIAILQKAKTTLENSLTIVKEIDITEFSNKEYDLTFLSSYDREKFQNNKSQIIDHVQQLSNSNVADQMKEDCYHSETLYQQLKCYQEENQKINDTINNFHNFDRDYQDNYQKFIAIFQKAKTKLEDLLTIVEDEKINQEYFLDFLSPKEYNKLQEDKDQIIADIKNFENSKEEECLHNKTPRKQLKCFQKNVNNLDINYRQVESKKQLLKLIHQLRSLDIDELNITKSTLDFFSHEKQDTFRKNKEKIITEVLELREKILSPEFLKFNLLKKLQYRDREINSQIISKQLATYQTFKKQYLDDLKSLLPIKDIQQGIEKIQTELEDIFDQDPDNVIEGEITIILQEIKDFEDKFKDENQPWLEFKTYHDFLVQSQDDFKEKKRYVDKIVKNIAAIKVAHVNNDIALLISTINFNKKHSQLLAQISQIDWQTYKDDFYDEPNQKQFQQQKTQLQQEINQYLNTDCDQINLKDQKECWLGFNHQITQTISNFHHFNNSYYQNYQAFNNTFNDTKNQFHDLLTNISTLNITTFNNTQYDLDFLSPEGQNVFQNNKSQIIDTIKQLNHPNIADQIKKTCSQNKTLYQQLKCYQEENQLINKTMKEFNSFNYDYQNIYQLFNVSFDDTKTKFGNLLSNTATEFDSDEQALKNLNLSAAVITKFNADAKQVLSLIKQFDTVKEVKCFQNKNLYQQAKCYRENVANLNTGYDKMKAQKQFLELKNQFLTLDVTELKTTKFDVGFLSSEQQNKFSIAKEKMIKMITKYQAMLQNQKQVDDIQFSSSLKYYQVQNQKMTEQLTKYQDFKKQYFDSFKSSLSKLISEIQPEIAITQAKQTKLLSITQKTNQEQDIVNQITTTIQEITQKIKDFEQKVTEYEEQPWSAFKAYHDFLVQYQTILTKSKDDIFEAKEKIEFVITGGTVF